MKARKRLSRVTRLQKAQEICDLYSKGTFTIASCCEAIGIPYDTFKDWAQPNLSEIDVKEGNVRKGFIPEVHEMYLRTLIVKDANYALILENYVKASLFRMVRGEGVEETTTYYRANRRGKLKPIREKTVTKVKLPNVNVLIFLAKALDPAFSPDKCQEIPVKSIGVTGLEHLSLEELELKRKALNQILLSDSDL